MAPISGRLGRMFGRKLDSERTPSKALYDDLESAHESIARKASSASLVTTSREHSSSSKSALSNDVPPLQPLLPVLDKKKYDPRTSIKQKSAKAPNPLMPPVDLEELRPTLTTHTSLDEQSFFEFPPTSTSNDVTSQWQTTKSRSTNERYKLPSPDPGLVNQLAISHQPSDEATAGNLAYYPLIEGPDASRLVASDTVDNILRTYGNGTANPSLENSEHQHMYDDVSEDALASYERQEDGDELYTTSDFSHDSAECGTKEPTSAQLAPIAMTIESAGDAAKVEAALIAEGDMHLASLRPSESFKTTASAELDDYAWSPCSSGEGDDQPGTTTNVRMPVREMAQSTSDDALTNGAVSTGGGNTSSSPESYGNTQHLLQLSSSGVSNFITSNSHQFHAPSTSVGSSKLAGDLLLPAKRYAVGDRQISLSSISRFSGIVTDGKRSRPMSEAELSDSINSLIIGLPKASFVDEKSSKLLSQASKVGNFRLPRRAATLKSSQRAGDSRHDMDAGTSQTDSPESHALSAHGFPNRESRQELHRGTSSSKLREATPPGLFGRRPIYSEESTSSESRPALFRQNSRLAKAAAAAGIKQDGRLGRAMAGSPEKDWITETELVRSGEQTRNLQLASTTGSSLADYSDSGDLSNAEQNQQGQQSQQNAIQVQKRLAAQDAAHPRYNQSWTLYKNLRTGSDRIVPDYVSREGSRLPDMLSPPQARNFTAPGPSPQYRHPKPLPGDHQHPLSSSPVMTPSGIELRRIGRPENLTTQQKRMEMARTESEYSCPTDDDWEGLDRQESASHSGYARGTESETSHHWPTLPHIPSETWLSTVSEAQSGQPSPRARVSSFAKMTLLGRKGNMTGTPEGHGAREVGSSLADNSSPAANFSSSPPILNDSPPVHQLSPIADLATPRSPPSAIKAFHHHLNINASPSSGFSRFGERNSTVSHDSFGYLGIRKAGLLDSSGAASPSKEAFGRRLKDRLFQASAASSSRSPQPGSNKSTSPVDNATQKQLLLGSSTISVLHPPEEQEKIDWLKYLPATGPQKTPGRRSSSSESDGRVRATPTALKVSALQPNKQSGHQKRRSLGVNLGISDANLRDFETGHEDNVEERATSRIRAVESRNSLLTRFEGSATPHIKTPTPLNDDPYLSANPFAQPMSQAIAPRLFGIRHYSYMDTMKLQIRCSRFWALVCIFVPFLGPLYGHGYLDGLMVWHSDGEIQTFRSREKTMILVYSYTFFVATLVALTLAMILVGV